jgi:hypothetical protein
MCNALASNGMACHLAAVERYLDRAPRKKENGLTSDENQVEKDVEEENTSWSRQNNDNAKQT